MKVPLLDLKAQYTTIQKEIEPELLRVAASQNFILGPEVEKMEKLMCDYIGCSHAFGISSGTDALLIALMAIDVKPGDEIIVPTYSFFATAGVVARLNAVPVLVDSDPVTFNINPGKIESRITKKTKAIIPVHLYGQSADLDPIVAIAKKHGIKVIEDGAQAIGVQYKNGKQVGTIGDIGCFSFFPSKNLGCFGDGGLVTTNSPELAEKLKILRVHGGKPKYYHKIIGGNFRLDALQAAIISVKLPHLDSWSAKRRYNADLYTSLFKQFGLAEDEGKIAFNDKNKVLIPQAVYKNSGHANHHIYNQYVIRVENRDQLREFLTGKEIGTEIYYPVPFHRQECFTYLNEKENDFPNANFSAEKSIALPIFPELREEQIKYVVEEIAEFFKSK